MADSKAIKPSYRRNFLHFLPRPQPRPPYKKPTLLTTTMAFPKPPSLRCLRSFSTTPHARKPAAQPQKPPRYTKGPPPYPYGPAQHYKQSDSGLYGGATIQFGNKVSEKNALKSRRTWLPNMHSKRLWSDSLGRFVQVKVQARVLRTIDKCGGLDEYLLGEKPGRIKELGVEGWRLRWLVMRTGQVKRRVKGEREALGLAGREAATTPGKALGGRATGGTETLEDVVERASGDVVERIEGTQAGPKGSFSAADVEYALNPSSASERTALEEHIDRTTIAIQAEISAEASRQVRPPNPEANPAIPTGRRYAKGEEHPKRLSLDADDDEVESAASALMAEVARIDEVVEAEMEEAEGEGRERLERAMGRLRSAGEELERVKAAVAGKGNGMGMEVERGPEGGILGRIKGLFGRG